MTDIVDGQFLFVGIALLKVFDIHSQETSQGALFGEGFSQFDLDGLLHLLADEFLRRLVGQVLQENITGLVLTIFHRDIVFVRLHHFGGRVVAVALAQLGHLAVDLLVRSHIAEVFHHRQLGVVHLHLGSQGILIGEHECVRILEIHLRFLLDGQRFQNILDVIVLDEVGHTLVDQLVHLLHQQGRLIHLLDHAHRRITDSESWQGDAASLLFQCSFQIGCVIFLGNFKNNFLQ